jgi:hypothetical protein
MFSASEWDESHCLSQLASFLEESGHKVPSLVIFRFASFYNFDTERAKAAILASAADDTEYIRLRMEGALVQQFERKVLFPLSGVTTKKGKSSVIYMRPSRHQQSVRSEEELLIENLLYVLNDCSRTEQECRKGVSLLVNMKDWNTSNFNQQTWARFMKTLQGEYVPTKVRKILFAGASRAFVNMWRLEILPEMCVDLIKGTHFIKQEKVRDFLSDGFEDNMPEEFHDGGRCWGRDIDELVEDYIDLKLYNDQKGRDPMEFR